MKFLTLLKKELREAVPWIILAVITLFIIGWFIIRLHIIYYTEQFYFGILTTGTVINQGFIFRTDIIQGIAVLMFFISILLGLALGIRHFWIPGFTRTWQFLIHRSIKKSTVLSAKISAAAILLFCLSLAWLLLISLISISEKIIVPPDAGIVWLGIFYAYLGFIVYIGTSLCAITRTRWYTTKMFGLFFVFIMYLMILGQTKFLNAFLITFVVLALLIIQVYHIFLQREF